MGIPYKHCYNRGADRSFFGRSETSKSQMKKVPRHEAPAAHTTTDSLAWRLDKSQDFTSKSKGEKNKHQPGDSIRHALNHQEK